MSRDPRFLELDRLIALDPEPTENRRAKPVTTCAYSLRQINRIWRMFKRHPCFICKSKRCCSHREPGVIVAVMERKEWNRKHIFKNPSWDEPRGKAQLELGSAR